jgi:hypothetical protein
MTDNWQTTVLLIEVGVLSVVSLLTWIGVRR